MSLRDFTCAYLEAMFWAEMIKYGPNEGEPFDQHYEEDALTPKARTEIEKDCAAFYEEKKELWERGASDEQAGHDFYLTRNGHGAGFWDRPELYGKESAELLSKASEVYGTQGLDHDENGNVYTHN